MTARIRIPEPITLTVPAQITDDHDHAAAVRTAWLYDHADPYQLTLRITISPGAQPRYTKWVFARDLLWHGLAHPTGEGDVRISPADSNTATVELTSPDGHAVLTFPLDALAAFAARVYALVPDGQEPELDLSDVECVLRAAAEVGEDW